MSERGKISFLTELITRVGPGAKFVTNDSYSVIIRFMTSHPVKLLLDQRAFNAEIVGTIQKLFPQRYVVCILTICRANFCIGPGASRILNNHSAKPGKTRAVPYSELSSQVGLNEVNKECLASMQKMCYRSCQM